MYSEEIKQLLEVRNYLVTIQEYKWIVTSPQITYIKYENDEFYIKTSDNYTFKLKIRKE
jgi:hypothetical protein